MTYKSKNKVVNMAAGLILGAIYLIYALGKQNAEQMTLKGWAVALLIFIGIGIVGMIIIQILFRVGASIGIAMREKNCDDKQVERILLAADREDEMDQQVSLRAARAGYVLAGLGVMSSLIALALGATPVLALHVTVGGFFAASLLEGGVSIYGYERGLSHG